MKFGHFRRFINWLSRHKFDLCMHVSSHFCCCYPFVAMIWVPHHVLQTSSRGILKKWPLTRRFLYCLSNFRHNGTSISQKDAFKTYRLLSVCNLSWRKTNEWNYQMHLLRGLRLIRNDIFARLQYFWDTKCI